MASHDKELDRVRQQYQSDMDQLRRSMEDISQVRPWGGLLGRAGGRGLAGRGWGGSLLGVGVLEFPL